MTRAPPPTAPVAPAPAAPERTPLAPSDRAKNLRPKRNIKTAMAHEIMLYGIAQKEQMGFDSKRLPI